MAECSSYPSKDGCSKDKENCMIQNNTLNNVKKVIGVMRGKGGVGKSSISVIIAKYLKQLGYNVGILDADITGPSISRLLGITNKKITSIGAMMVLAKISDGICSSRLSINDSSKSSKYGEKAKYKCFGCN